MPESSSSAAADAESAENVKRTIKIGSQRESAGGNAGSAQVVSPGEPTTPEVAPGSHANTGTGTSADLLGAGNVAATTDERSGGASPPTTMTAWSTDLDPSTAPTELPSVPRDMKMSDMAVPGKVSIPRKDDVDDDELAAALGTGSPDMTRLLLGDTKAKPQSLAPETRLPATVVKVYRDSVFVVLPGQFEGVCSIKQFATPPEPGTRLEVVITGYLAEEGLYELSVPGGSVDVGDWSDLAEGVVVEAKITASNTGGLECDVNHIRGFIPASQVSLYRVEDFSDYVGQKLLCVVTEANPGRRNLVLSHRAVLERERAEKRQGLLNELQVGSVRDGVVTNVKDFGAFVDMGGIEGLIHVSQLSWERIKHPSEVIQTGQQVRVRVEKIDPQTGKIGLSYRDLLEHPWQSADAQFPLGAVVPGTVTRIMEFGAFVRIGPGLEGLVHISELSHQRVRRVGQVVSEGQEVQVKILSLDREAQRMSLSIKAAQAAQAAAAAEAEEESEEETVVQALPRATNVPLKGGTDRRSGGDNFGLKW